MVFGAGACGSNLPAAEAAPAFAPVEGDGDRTGEVGDRTGEVVDRTGEVVERGGEPATSFSGRRAFEHLEKLAAIGPRVSGTRGAARARRYLERRLREIGASTESVVVVLPEADASEASAHRSRPREGVHLVALLPGESSDRLLLAAAYDTRAIPDVELVGANASGSGPALLLELARSLSLRPRHYTLMFVLIDGDALPPSAPGVGFAGSRALAARLASQGELARIRVAIFFQQLANRDLRVARDLHSHPVYRESFWEAAALLGRREAFPPAAPVESVEGSHLEFIEQGLPRSVLIADPRGGDALPGWFEASADDTPERCSPESLQVVGEVTLAALDRITTRLQRIDRFHVSPLRDPLAREPAAGGMTEPVIPTATPGETSSD